MKKLPPGWEWTTLGAVAEVNPRTSKALLEDSRPVSFVPMAAVAEESGVMDTSDVRAAGDLKPKSYRQFAEGDLLVAKITPSMENGKAAVARGLSGGQGFGSTEFHVLRPRQGIAVDYLMHFVLQPWFRARAARNMTGTAGQLRVPADYLRSCDIPVPPTGEQERIVAAIEEHLSRLDSAVAATVDGIGRMGRLRLERIESAVASAGEMTTLESYAVPGGITDGPFGSKLKSSHYAPEGPRVIRLENIGIGEFVDEQTRIPRTYFEQLRNHEAVGGDLVVASLVSDRLRACIVPADLGPAIVKADCIRVRLRPEVEPRFLNYALMRPSLNEFVAENVRGVGRSRLGLGNVRRLPVPGTAPDIQRRVVKDLDAQLGPLTRTVEQCTEATTRANALRRSILAEAFAGNLVPQDPNEEPASVLLDRMRSERGGSATRRRRKAKLS